MSSTQSAHPLSAGSGPDQIHSNNASPTSAEGPAGLDTSQNGDKRTRRGVRHLSEQQLEKKRKNDREAQRAIRERTKNQIEALEMRVKELESGQAYQQMQELRRERDELQAENEKIKASLIRVQALIQPLLGTIAGHEGVLTSAITGRMSSIQDACALRGMEEIN